MEPLVQQRSANRAHLIRGSAYYAPTFLSLRVGYSALLAPYTGTTSGDRSSTPIRDLGIPKPGQPRPATDSHQNTVTGAEGTILEQAMALMPQYPLFDNPLQNPVPLISQKYIVWGKALETISDAGNIVPLQESVKRVS